ncbi:hypothetical protein KEM55_002978 [Ascosphaera atra]|nr:hypothetical protein KEM55_002978 [Ascosphaera atra]
MQRKADVAEAAGSHEPAQKSRRTNTESEKGGPNALQSTNETSELLPAPLRPKKSAKRLTSQMLAGKEPGNRREPTRAPAPKLDTRNGETGVQKMEPRPKASLSQRQGSKKAPSSAGRTAATQRKPWRHDVAMPEEEMDSFAPQSAFTPADARRSHVQPSNNGATAVRRSSHVSLDGSTTHPLSGLYSSGSLANASTSSFKKRKRKPSGRGGFTGAKNPSVPSRTPESAAASRPSPSSLAERNASTRRTQRLSKGADSTHGERPQPVPSRQGEKSMNSMSSPPEASSTMSRMTMRTGGGSTRASKPRRRFSDSSSDEAGPLATSSLVSNFRGSGNRHKPRRNLQDSSDEDDIALPSTTRNKPFSAAPRGAHDIYSTPSDSAVSIGLVSALDYPNRNANGSRLASKQGLDVPEQENRKRGLFRIFSKSKRPSGDRASTPVPAATEDSVEKTKPQTLRRESNNASPSSDATVIRSPREANPLGRNQESFTNNTRLSPLASSSNVANSGNAASGPSVGVNLSHAGSAISPQATHDDRHSLPSASETPRRGSRSQSANQQSSPHSPQSKIMPPHEMDSSANAEVAPSPPSIATGGGSPPPLAKSGKKRKSSFWRRLFRSGSS